MNNKLKLVNLELIRKERKLTRKDLAKLSGVNEFTIQALETGKTNAENIKLSTLLALAIALRVRARRLLPDEFGRRL